MSKPDEKREPGRWRMLALLGVAAALLFGVAWAQRPDGRLHVYLLELPGDGLLLQSPAGRYVLIDGGRDPALLALQLGRHMPLWRRDLRATLLTAPGGRRLPGQVAALARYRVELALVPPELPNTGTAGEWRRLVAANNTPVAALRPGMRLALDGATLTVLDVAAGDEGGAVLLLSYGATAVLLHTGGSAGDQAARSVAGRPLDLLVYPWQRSLDPDLMAALRPRAIAFTSAYEAPTPALLSYGDRRRYSSRLYHTDNDGTIELISDGRKTWIATQSE